ncbi:MAG: hypothetical protein N2Z84_02805 [Atribacterota bacterium]|nr:hypothetical protein [Atribacterota bacterium]
MGGSQERAFVEQITWEEFKTRVQVLLPLLQGWNPDCLVAVNAEGLLLSGLVNRVLQKEVRTMNIQEEPWQVLWERIGDLKDKRVAMVTGRFLLASTQERIELFLKERGALSILKMVILGRKGDYSCFPEKGEETLLPWEEHAAR